MKIFPLRSREDDHLSRKIFHIASGTLVAFLFAGPLTRQQSLIITVIVLAVFLPVDILRLFVPRLNRRLIKIYGPLLRKNEDREPSAQFYYVLGMAWATLVLPKTIAVQAILTLAWMDPMAAIFGVRFGKKSWNEVFRKLYPRSGRDLPRQVSEKTFEGSLAGFIAAFLCGLVAWFLLGPSQMGASTLQILALCAVGALTSVVAEAWPSQWDDNASIPFWTGLIVWGLASIMGLPLSYF